MLYIKAGAASMAGAWFIHWLVRLVRGLYGPVLGPLIPDERRRRFLLTEHREPDMQSVWFSTQLIGLCPWMYSESTHWSSYLRRHIDCLERVQRRATEMVIGFCSLPCELRLKQTSLEKRRQRRDLVEAYKIWHARKEWTHTVSSHWISNSTAQGDTSWNSEEADWNWGRIFFRQRVMPH